jgi:pyruvate formate lyase activating enzyme
MKAMNGLTSEKGKHIVKKYPDKGIVFDIQRYSLEDGPGIRTAVFLKGCPLDCVWCSNPESRIMQPELAYFFSNCKKCGNCIKRCSLQAIVITDSGVKIDRSRCNLCAACVQECVNSALEIIGKEMSVEGIIREVVRDKPFYEDSKGGLTLTGGEPTYQNQFSTNILKAAKYEGIHTAIETCGYARWTELKKLLNYTDLVLFDVKIISDELSKEYTGCGSKFILENLKRIDSTGKTIFLRFPLIPCITDSLENLEAVADIAKGLKNVAEIDILPFHQYGKHKYRSLGYSYMLYNHEPVQRNEAMKVAEFFTRAKLNVKLLGQ